MTSIGESFVEGFEKRIGRSIKDREKGILGEMIETQLRDYISRINDLRKSKSESTYKIESLEISLDEHKVGLKQAVDAAKHWELQFRQSEDKEKIIEIIEFVAKAEVLDRYEDPNYPKDDQEYNAVSLVVTMPNETFITAKERVDDES